MLALNGESGESFVLLKTLREMGWGMDWIHLAQDRDQWNVRVNMILNFRKIFDIVCMYKGWALKSTLAPRPSMMYCA
jgi:hypothetical protein